MSTIEKPKTQREMIDQLWFAVVGSNGDGIAAVTRRNSRDIQEIKEILPTLQTRADACEDDEKIEKKNERRRVRQSDVIQWAIMAGVAILVGIPAWLEYLGG